MISEAHTISVVVIQRRIHRRSSKRTAPAWVMPRRIAILLCQPKVNRVQYIALRTSPHEKVARRNVAVQEAVGVNVLQPRDGLVREEQHRLDGEAPPAVRQEVLQGRAEALLHQDVVVVLLPEPMRLGDPDAAAEFLVRGGLCLQRAGAVSVGHEFDGHFATQLNVGP